MSDLTATNCGCNNGCGSVFSNGNGCNWIWIILLFSCFGNGNGGLFSNNGCGCNNGCDNNNSCEWLIWILLISCFFGNNNSCCG